MNEADSNSNSSMINNTEVIVKEEIDICINDIKPEPEEISGFKNDDHLAVLYVCEDIKEEQLLNEIDVYPNSIMEHCKVKEEAIPSSDVNVTNEEQCKQPQNTHLDNVIDDSLKKIVPKDILELKGTHPSNLAVFAVKDLPSGIIFGPFEGLAVLHCTAGTAWKLTNGNVTQAENTTCSSWMQYVKTAARLENLAVFQHKAKLYYKTRRRIAKGEKLLVHLGQDHLTDDTNMTRYYYPTIEEVLLDNHSCTTCCVIYNSRKLCKAHRIRCQSSVRDVEEGYVECPPDETDSLKRSMAEEQNERGCISSPVPGGEKPFQCNICNKSFSTPVHLNKHSRIHARQKPPECEFCKRSSGIRQQLNRDLHTPAGEKPHECETCKKCFGTRARLVVHSRIHTGEKPFECEFCGKTFMRRDRLVTHIDTHTGEKRYTCKTCEKCFTVKSSLTAHMRIHSGEKPFECKICKKCFRVSGDLGRHVRRHTGEKPLKRKV